MTLNQLCSNVRQKRFFSVLICQDMKAAVPKDTLILPNSNICMLVEENVQQLNLIYNWFKNQIRTLNCSKVHEDE